MDSPGSPRIDIENTLGIIWCICLLIWAIGCAWGIGRHERADKKRKRLQEQERTKNAMPI